MKDFPFGVPLTRPRILYISTSDQWFLRNSIFETFFHPVTQETIQIKWSNSCSNGFSCILLWLHECGVSIDQKNKQYEQEVNWFGLSYHTSVQMDFSSSFYCDFTCMSFRELNKQTNKKIILTIKKACYQWHNI